MLLCLLGIALLAPAAGAQDEGAKIVTYGAQGYSVDASQINVEDRWAIVAYERALQFSQHATLGDVPEDRRGDLDRPATAPAGETPRPEAP